MIKTKHLMEAFDKEDGSRLWVEPIGLTKDLRSWCAVDHVLSHLGPPLGLWQWFAEHPDGYGYFRATYHDYLAKSRLRPALMELANAGQKETFTLVHTGDDPEHNTATALQEFLASLTGHFAADNP